MTHTQEKALKLMADHGTIILPAPAGGFVLRGRVTNTLIRLTDRDIGEMLAAKAIVVSRSGYVLA